MSIRVTVSQALTEYSTGSQLGEVNGNTVGECLEQLTLKAPNLKQWLFDENGVLHEYVDLFINKGNAFPEPLAKPIKDGDELHIMCLIGGG